MAPSPAEPAFALDARLAASSVAAAELGLCQARLQNDRRWPWIVLVPRRPRLVELEELDAADRLRLLDEIEAAGRAVREVGEALGFGVEKLNLGALGNVVSQLHVHVVGRRREDPAWPGPVWGFGAQQPYSPEELGAARSAAAGALSRHRK